jgi:hypothetical protein
MNRPGRETSGSMSSAVGLISNTIQCWWNLSDEPLIDELD